VTDPSELESFFAGVLGSSEHVVFVATASAPLGYAWAQDITRPRTVFTNAGRVAYINHVAVAPHARRTGVATALCRAVEDEARSRGINDVALDHWAFNREAAAFFEGAGFVDFNIRMRRQVAH
jgi:ribosomal protein S18 acetylase RimI-like enzyme